MLSIFQYDFMIKAFLVAIVIAVIAPCIGVTVVLKRLSAIGDATSHAALGGIALGLVAGFNPVLGAVIFAVAAVLCIEGLRQVFSRYSEIAAVVVMSAGIGLTGVLSSFVKGSSNLSSFLFGSIVAVSNQELILTILLGIIVAIISFVLYKEMFSISFDEENAALCGVPVKKINLVFMVLTAVTVAVSSRIVGALMISSLLVLPTAAAMMLAKSYRGMFIISILLAMIATIAGLFISFYFNLSTGGTIVLTGVVILIVALLMVGRKDA